MKQTYVHVVTLFVLFPLKRQWNFYVEHFHLMSYCSLLNLGHGYTCFFLDIALKENRIGLW